MRVQVSYLRMGLLELGSSPCHVVQKIPEFGLQEISVDFPSVFDLLLENVGVMFVLELGIYKATVTIPLEPHMPVD